jgi:hypothetical protein
MRALGELPIPRRIANGVAGTILQRHREISGQHHVCTRVNTDN